MMLRDQALHNYLCNKAETLTEEWYQSLDKNRTGVYGSKNPDVIQKVKAQNTEFHLQFCKLFEESNTAYIEDFQDWIKTIANDDAHLNTPLEEIIEEFFRTQKQYLKLIEEYILQHEESISISIVMVWSQGIVDAINQIILQFTNQHTQAAENRLNAQQEMIIEMSAPVILLSKDVGFLPLIGEINTHRAQVIFEKALAQSSDRHLRKLFVDLSGVPIIDTMVAHQIFQLISGLKLIGVQTALSGISPEIAQTAVQLGLKFNDIEIHNTLAQAMELEKLKIM